MRRTAISRCFNVDKMSAPETIHTMGMWRIASFACAFLLTLGWIFGGDSAGDHSGSHRVASQITLKFFNLHEPATTDFEGCGILPEALFPIGDGPPHLEEDRDLLDVLKKVFFGVEKTNEIEAFLARHPTSRWRLSLLVNAGILYRQTGYFTSSERCLNAAITTGLANADSRSTSMTDRAIAELAGLYAWMGNVELLGDLFNKIKERPVRGPAAHIITQSKQQLEMLRSKPDEYLTCGPYALSIILQSQRVNKDHEHVLNSIRSILRAQGAYIARRENAPEGALPGSTLKDVLGVSQALGMEFIAARAPEKHGPLPVPCIVHWKLNHFSAIVERVGGRYRFGDASPNSNERGDASQWISEDAIRESTSGVFLIPSGDLPAGWKPVEDAEARRIVGRGPVNGNTPACTDCDKAACGTDGGCPTSPKMPAWSFKLTEAALSITDTPWWMDMPNGPDLDFSIKYTDVDTSVIGTSGSSHLGGKWTTRWLSRCVPDTANGRLTYYPPGGGEVVISIANVNGVYKGRHYFTPASFEYTPGIGCVVKFDTGDTTEYLQTVGTNCHMSRQLLQSGFVIRYIYDVAFPSRLIAVDNGQDTGTTYRAELIYQNGSDSYMITGVRAAVRSGGTFIPTNPNRACTLTYDGTLRLTSVTDMGGLTSNFSYNAVNQSVIDTLTTPYGSTSFIRGSDTSNVKWIEAVYPNDDKERVESRMDSLIPLIPNNEPYAPTGMNPVRSSVNAYLNYRNVLVWDRKAYRMTTFKNSTAKTSTASEIANATIYHFLHSADGTKMGRVLESIKQPGSNRIWYTYPGQNQQIRGDDTVYETNMTLASPDQIATVGPDGQTILQTITYTAGQQVETTTDPRGRAVRRYYGANGIDVSEIRAGTGTNAPFLGSAQYSGSTGLPTTILGADGRPTTISYGTIPTNPDYRQIVQVTPPQRNLQSPEPTTFFYYQTTDGDGRHAGRLKSVKDHQNNTVVSYVYDDIGRIIAVSDRENTTVQLQYNANDQVTQVTYPDGTTEDIVYLKTAGGVDMLDPERTKDRQGRWTRMQYNAIRQVILTTNAENQSTAFEWCRCGALQKLTDPLGRTTQWSYDVSARLTAKTLPDGTKITYEYEPDYNVVSPLYGNAAAIYGGLGRLLRVTDAKGNKTDLFYNKDGSIAKRVHRDANGWPTLPGDVNRDGIVSDGVINTTDQAAVNASLNLRRYQTGYDPFADQNGDGIVDSADLALVTARAGTSYSTRTDIWPFATYTYDTQFARLLSMTDGVGTTTISYNPYPTQAVGTAPPVGSLTAWPGGVASVNGPLGGAVDPDLVAPSQFDEWGRVLGSTFAGMSSSVGYDLLGRVTTFSDGLGSGSLTWVGQTGRVNTVTQANGLQTAFTYLPQNQNFRLASMAHTIGGTTAVSSHSYGYSADGTITSWTIANGAAGGSPANSIAWAFSYDNINQLMSAVKKKDGSVIQTLGYRYDQAGNRIASQREAGGTTSIQSGTFNNLNQLQGTAAGGSVRVEGHLNEAGTVTVDGKPARMLSTTQFAADVAVTGTSTQFVVVAKDGNNNTTSKTYRVDNAGVEVRAVAYDINGNCLGWTVPFNPTKNIALTWDVLDRLSTISYGVGGSGGTTEFAYNSAGQRVRMVEKDGSGAVMSDTWYVWGGARVALELTGPSKTNLTIARRFLGEGFLVGTTKYWYTRDHLGSVRDVVDANGTVVARYDYDPYGNREKVFGAVDVEVGYTGHWHHARSGFALTWFRAYDPVMGRWLSRDPIGEEGGLNLYEYVNSNPVNYIDPTGELPVLIPIIIWSARLAPLIPPAVQLLSRNSQNVLRALQQVSFRCGQINFTTQQIQAKFKHALDFGVQGNWNPSQVQPFVQAISTHVATADKVIQGTYGRGAQPQAVTIYLKGNIAVIVDKCNNFISGWQLSPGQLMNVLQHGKLGGG
jgi:RHS repeat-associated protein